MPTWEICARNLQKIRNLFVFSNIFWINLTHIFIAIQHPLFFWIERVQIGGFKTSFFQRVCQYLTGQYVANLLFMREIVLEI